MSGWRTLLPNAAYIAAREYRGRIATRSFLLGTILLAAIAFAATESPVLIDYLQGNSQTNVAVYTALTDLPADSARLLDSQLNPQSDSSNGHKSFVVSWFQGNDADMVAAQQELQDGEFAALLIIGRDPKTADLTFTLRTDMPADGRQTNLLQNAVAYVAVDDRLVRAGVSIASVQQAPAWSVVPVKSSVAGEAPATTSVAPWDNALWNSGRRIADCSVRADASASTMSPPPTGASAATTSYATPRSRKRRSKSLSILTTAFMRPVGFSYVSLPAA